MKKLSILGLVLFLGILAACSDNSDPSNKGEESASTESESTDDNSTGSIAFEDGVGEMTIDGVPKKVVVLEWTYVEHLLPLDVEPVGVADLEGYNKWVNVGDPLSDSVTDVGTRSEPNFEAISRLDPDLIIGAKYRHESFKDQLESIAPTALFDPYSEKGAEDQYQHLLNEFNTLGKVFNKEEKAKQYIKQMEATFKEQGERIQEAGYENLNAVVAQAFTSQNTPTMRLFTHNSVIAGVLNKMNASNAVKTEKPEIYGFISTNVEALQNYQDSHFFFLVQDDDPIFDNLADNPAWTNLNFVEKNHTYKLPGDMGTFAGPLSAERFSKEIADALVEK
ncbi:MAG: iron-siderophore ABC transporter substrate-binding protein [Halobacillus sp.]|uniref:ABC transporter substrate-binding protein n=1 Tax=Halobacillus sp. TaxID=56800 RepID=UPI003BB199CB